MSEFAGALGEVYAARYLREKGYDIVSANYRTRMGEIDLVAQKKEDELIFVEVKTRSEGMIALPAESVGGEKQKRIALAASQYIKKERPGLHARFDVIEVYLDDRDALQEIRHIPDAFDSVL